MLRGEGGDGVEAELSARGAQSISDGEDAWIEHADDIPGVGLFDDLPLGGHELLGPGELELFAALDVIDLLVGVEPAGDQAHEGDAVPVGLVHIGLNLEHKGGEIVVRGVHQLLARRAGQGRRGHAQEVLQKGLHAKVRESGAEEHRGELAVAHPVHVKLTGGTV